MRTLEPMLATTFEQPVSFSCLQGCGLCCSYKVHLLTSDIERLRPVFDVGQTDSVEDACLPKKSGFCSFLDEQQRCGVYDCRPLYCRTFPFYVENGSEIDIDLTCPGVGQGLAVTQEYFRQLCLDHTSQAKAEHSDQKRPLSESLIKSKVGLTDRNDFMRSGLQWCKEVREANSFAEIVESTLNYAGRHGQLWFSIEEVLRNLFDIGTILNIRMLADGSCFRYPVELSRNMLVVEGHQYTLTDERHHRASDFCLEDSSILCKYLGLWFRRSIFYSFCIVSSLQAPMFYHAQSIAFAFIAELVRRVALAADVLSEHWSNEGCEIDKAKTVKEAIRLLDGRLRTKCRTVSIETCNTFL